MFKIIIINNYNITIILPSRATNFRSTIIKLYKREFNGYIINNDKNSPSDIGFLADIIFSIDTADDPDVNSNYNKEVDDFLYNSSPYRLSKDVDVPKTQKTAQKIL